MNEVFEYLKKNNGQVNEDFTDLFRLTSPYEIQAAVNEYEKEVGAIDWSVTHG